MLYHRRVVRQSRDIKNIAFPGQAEPFPSFFVQLTKRGRNLLKAGSMQGERQPQIELQTQIDLQRLEEEMSLAWRLLAEITFPNCILSICLAFFCLSLGSSLATFLYFVPLSAHITVLLMHLYLYY